MLEALSDKLGFGGGEKYDQAQIERDVLDQLRVIEGSEKIHTEDVLLLLHTLSCSDRGVTYETYDVQDLGGSSVRKYNTRTSPKTFEMAAQALESKQEGAYDPDQEHQRALFKSLWTVGIMIMDDTQDLPAKEANEIESKFSKFFTKQL